MTSAQVLKHSINPDGQPIITFRLRYPRYIHAELMTHRDFSRNAASSRAIPIRKMIEDVMSDPVIPCKWGRNQSGMQSFEELSPEESARATANWLLGRDRAVETCRALSEENEVHKQWANRVLEPWMHIEVLVTTCRYENFYGLRCEKGVHPDFQQLSWRMLNAQLNSTPQRLEWGQWHIGYDFPQTGEEGLSIVERIKIATARAARLSYLTFDNAVDVAKDIGLHDGLSANGHWSPFEHCAVAESAKPRRWFELLDFVKDTSNGLDIDDRLLLECLTNMVDKNVNIDQGNFRGFTPYRKHFPGENRSCDLQATMAAKPDWITLE